MGGHRLMPAAFVLNGLLRVAALGLAGLAAPLAVLLLNAAGRDALHGPVHAQSSPSISIELSPGHSVPMDTAITGTVTLTGLDFDSYSSVIFRADITPYGDGETKCNGDDTGMDIEIPVDESREVFTVRIFDACASAYYSYGTYTLDVSISRVETDPLGDWVELASAHTQFLMSRYLIAGEQTATTPDPDAQAWMDPAPRTLDIYVGEWLRFQFRSDVTKYLNDHLGVLVNGSEFGLFATGGSSPPTTPSTDPEEACLRDQDSDGHWRRAIHQSLWIVACRPGDARILLTHETHAGDPFVHVRVPYPRNQHRHHAPDLDRGGGCGERGLGRGVHAGPKRDDDGHAYRQRKRDRDWVHAWRIPPLHGDT